MLSIQEFVGLNVNTSSDTLFAHQRIPQDFAFDKDVVTVFPDMIGRSVPGYWESAEWIGMLSRRFSTAKGTIYDLGCSLGAVSWGIYRNWGHQCPTVIAVDNSTAMITQFKNNLSTIKQAPPFEVHHADICQFPISNASMVVMHFTLQFIPIERRLDLLKRIYDGLKPGGVLVLSEKLLGKDEKTELRLRRWHHDFKRSQGYSDLEIQQKSDAIANVMPLDSPKIQKTRLQEAGFSTLTTWLKCFNFSSLIAEKSK